MGWIALVLALGIITWLFIAAPKQMFILSGCLLLAIGVIALFVFEDDLLQDDVDITVAHDPGSCPASHPLAVSIWNSSRKTITKTTWGLKATSPGYSSNLIDEYRTYETDRVIKPGQSFRLCFSIPTLSKPSAPSQLVWSVAYQRAYFGSN